MSKEDLNRPWPTFNLSASFRNTWLECRRAAFWKTWWSWGAWHEGPTSASESRRLAYAIRKATSIWSLAGSVVHRHAARFSRLAGHGRDLPAPDQAIGTALEEYRDAVDKARRRSWKRASKKAPILLEAFYGMDPDKLAELVDRGARRVEDSIRNLGRSEHLATLAAEAKAGRRPLVHVEDACQVYLEHDVRDDQPGPAIAIAGIRPGERVELWVVPDLAYSLEVAGGGGRRELVIVDWKTGAPKPEHRAQLAIYATWANAIGWEADQVLLVASYLEAGDVREYRFNEEEGDTSLLELVDVLDSVREVVEGGDLVGMVPIMDSTGSAFPPLPEGSPECLRCDWRRLCERG